MPLRRRHHISSLLLIVALFPAPDSLAQPDTTSTGKRHGYVLIPGVFYTPETELAAGVFLMYYFRPTGAAPDRRASSITPSGVVTERSQLQLSLAAELFLREELYWINTEIAFEEYPDKFWGIGANTPDTAEEDYTPRALYVSANPKRRLLPGLNAGVEVSFSSYEIVEFDSDGALRTGRVLGSKGGYLFAAGLTLTWDTRDNAFFPTSGSLRNISARRFFAGDYEFTSADLDLRQYFSPSGSVVVALQAAYDVAGPGAPFQMLPTFGGVQRMRGYYEGRYRDRQALIGQIDLRAKLGWRLGATMFASVGSVARSIRGFTRDGVRAAAGGGLRFFVNESEGVSLRIDFAGGGDSPGPYIYVNEAF